MMKDENTYYELALKALGAHDMKQLDAALDKERAALEKQFANKHRRLLAMTALMKETLLGLRERGWNTHADLWNIALHINLAAHDLSVQVWALCVERDIWARRLAARHVALMAFEISEDLTHLLGGSIRQALSSLGVLAMYESTLRGSKAPLNEFWRDHSQSLKNIRIVAAAHRDPDGLRLLDVTERLDLQELIQVGLQLNGILTDHLGPILQRVCVETANIAPQDQR